MPTKSAEYRLSPKAREDIEAVWLYSLAAWSAEQADRYTDDLTAAFAHLADIPKSGTSSEHIRAGYRRHSVLRHVIYYRETNYGIEVIRVLHNRMLASRHL
ncbi:MAG: type II toxin-antitoxin system RelE/ParE family toxin [Gammaproteobacteria bacterium]|nr:type II toxin-antitoxin system RelE/ParE family toxin [Gammaproteobacteria bacterium]